MHLALSATHVYWLSSNAIMRKAKAGGAVETVTTFNVGTAPYIDSGRLYWSSYPNIYGMPLDSQTPPETLATSATLIDAWTPRGDRVFFASEGTDGGNPRPRADLLSAPSSGAGDAVVLLRGIQASARMVADSTGVYWYDDQRALVEGGKGPGYIRKYTLATQVVTDFAQAQFVDYIVADGAHVVWADAASHLPDPTTVWSNTPEGNHPVALGAAPLVRQLAMDGSSAYWAASGPGDDYSDVLTSPLAGGPTRTIACHVYAVYALAVDDTDVYFSTYLASGAPGKIIGKIPKKP
jgi:hypothetical protein